MIFCLGEGKNERTGAGYQKNLHIFNVSVTEEVYNKVKSDLLIKNFKLPIAKWIESKDMTSEEKKSWTSHTETGGYLKTLSYQDAWEEMWSTMSEDDKKFFETIPNFNADIFEKITGIKTSLKGKKVEVKIDGITYTAVIE